MAAEPNVLLVVLDSVRAKNAGLYGHARETTPFLAEFAEEATVYEGARTPGARSITGHASLFTGRTVEGHGLTSADRRLRPGTTVFETLQSAGYETAVFSENVWITDVDIGLRRGFDTVVGPQNVPFPEALDARRFVAEAGRGNYAEFLRAAAESGRPLRSLANGAATKLAADYPRLNPFDSSPPGDVYLDRFLEWHDDRDGPWAACLNLMDAHRPYEPRPEHDVWGDDELRSLQERVPNDWQLLSRPEGWWKLFAVESLYDGAIRQADALVERLVATLRRRGELEETLLVITSDHGEGFGEPSRVRPGIRVAGHNTALHEVILHVPLVVRFPGEGDGERVSGLASVAEFPAAVADAREGAAGPDSFRTDTAYATSYGLLMDDQLRSRAERYGNPDELEGFNDRLRAVYEDDGDTVRKHVAWGDRRAVTVRIRDATTAYVEREIDPAEVDERFEAVDDAGLVEEGAGIDAVDEGTQKRLEDLGYM
ncbi:sulfatase [Natronomonas marina]|jgi:arylsulfatase|uniref:sulfatase n=1 Tax=Natronomonas marina TaxID=2961939 RepID=UPI0020C99465|nr:sulfatase [Natronomonas marina]